MAVPELNTSSLWQSDAVAVLAPLVHLMLWLCSGKTVCVGLAAAKQAVGIEPGMVPCCGESEPGMVRFAGKPDAAATVALQPLNIKTSCTVCPSEGPLMLLSAIAYGLEVWILEHAQACPAWHED